MMCDVPLRYEKIAHNRHQERDYHYNAVRNSHVPWPFFKNNIHLPENDKYYNEAEAADIEPEIAGIFGSS